MGLESDFRCIELFLIGKCSAKNGGVGGSLKERRSKHPASRRGREGRLDMEVGSILKAEANFFASH